MPRSIPWLVLSILAACGTPGAAPDDEPVVVSVIGGTARRIAPAASDLSQPAATLLAATAQGLVRFDAGGQIEPGLAIRWDVSDDGLYYTFRIGPDAGIDADAVARSIRAAAAPSGRNPLASELGAVAEVVAVTKEVVEIRLSAPRPDLLQLLAQPALAIPAGRTGSGPFRIAGRDRGAYRLTLLKPAEDPASPAEDVLLRGERAPLAVARFKAGKAGVVLGGRFTDLAIARADGGAGTTLRIDPATGLFGFAVVRNDGLLSAPEVRLALAAALDRDRIVRLFADGWAARASIVPAGTDDLADPATADWASNTPSGRNAAAAAVVADWRRRNPDAARALLRVAMPDGPGARMLFALAAQDWRRIGIDVLAVREAAPADLRLIDAVAPTGSAAWYLHRFACARSPVCSEAADLAMAAARAAPDPVTRAARLADADRRLAAVGAFIPIASPLRWSLVAPNLDGYRNNPRVTHALDQLRHSE